MTQVDLTARYLFGAPGADLAIEGEVLLRAAAGLTAYPGYVFGRYDAPLWRRDGADCTRADTDEDWPSPVSIWPCRRSKIRAARWRRW